MWFFRKKKKEKEKEEKIISPYPSFPYTADQLSAYMERKGFFIISFKQGRILRHEPEDPVSFKKWLVDNNVRDINDGRPL